MPEKHINPDDVVNRLVEENMKLAYYFVRQWPSDDPDEALSTAMEGLLLAAREWRVEKGCSFGTYAAHRIRWARQRKFVYIKTQKRGYGLTKLSLDAPIGDDSDTTLHEVLGETLAEEVVPKNATEEEARKAVLMLRELTPKEAFVVSRRFGIGCEARTLELVGDEIGITRERVRQIEECALLKLRKMGVFDDSRKRRSFVLEREELGTPECDSDSGEIEGKEHFPALDKADEVLNKIGKLVGEIVA